MPNENKYKYRSQLPRPQKKDVPLNEKVVKETTSKGNNPTHFYQVGHWFVDKQDRRIIDWAKTGTAQRASVSLFLKSVLYYDRDTVFSDEDVARARLLLVEVERIPVVQVPKLRMPGDPEPE